MNDELEGGSNSFLHKEKEDYFRKHLEKKRWGILIAIFFYTFTNQGTWCTYGPIVKPTETYYNISYTDVNWFIYSFYITYSLFSFFGSWLLYNKFALSIILGAIVNAVGSWMRYLGKNDFGIALTGQFIMGMSFCLVLEAPILVSQRWFHFRERFFVVTTLVLASSLGSGLGFLVPALIVGEDPNKVETMLLIEAIFCSLSLPFLFFLRDRPKVVPNMAESVQRPSFVQSFKMLIKNPKYNLAMMAFGTIYGNAWDLFSILGNLMDSSKVSNETIGIAGAVSVAVSVLVSFVINYSLNFCKNSMRFIDPMLKVLFTIGFLGFIAFSLTVQYQSTLCLYIVMVVLGISALSITPLCCTCLEELAFPIPESLSINFMFFTSNLFSLVISILVTMPAVGSYGTWILVGTLAPFYFYLMFWYKTDFFKSEQEGLYGSFNPPIETNEKDETITAHTSAMVSKKTNGQKDMDASDITIKNEESKDNDTTQDLTDNEGKKTEIKKLS